jgi:hypothetical protein
MSPGKPAITFRLAPEILGWVNGKAREQNITVSDFIRDLLLKEMEKQGEVIQTISIDPKELSLLKKIMEMKEQGLSSTKIAMELNKKGILTMKKLEWYAQTVIRAIEKYEAYVQEQQQALEELPAENE